MKCIRKKLLFFLIFLFNQPGQALQFNDLPQEIFCFICIQVKVQDFLRLSICSRDTNNRCQDKYLVDSIADRITPFSFVVLEDLPMNKRLYGLYLYANQEKEKFSYEPLLKGKKIVSFLKGQEYRVALTSDGEVYSWGYSYGFIDDKQFIDHEVDEPNLIRFKEPAVMIMGSQTKCFALTKDGDIHVWGPGIGGLGVKDLLYDGFYALFNRSRVFIILNIAPSSFYALTTNGVEYVWGENSKGELGLSHNRNISYPTRLNPRWCQPLFDKVYYYISDKILALIASEFMQDRIPRIRP